MVPFETLRSELVAALAAANSGLSGDRSYELCIRGLPSVDAPGAVAIWLYAVAGGDGTGGMIFDVRRQIAGGVPAGRKEDWLRAYDRLTGLGEMLRALSSENLRAA